MHYICRVQEIQSKKNVERVGPDGVFWKSTESPQHSGNTAARCISEAGDVQVEQLLRPRHAQSMNCDAYSRKIDIVSDDISHPK